MNLIRVFAVLVGLLVLTGVLAGTASATTVEDCQDQLSALRDSTEAAQSKFTNQKDFTGVLAKLDDAAVKLSEGKNADAVQKLTDFQNTLNALATAPKPKIDPAVALEPEQGLVAQAQGVIDCVNQLGTA
jgi:hypothetical protein